MKYQKCDGDFEVSHSKTIAAPVTKLFKAWQDTKTRSRWLQNGGVKIHHLEPDKGEHPKNVLIVCANCHAQLEHARVSEVERVMGWLVGVTINGQRFRVRQPFVHRTNPISLATVIALCFAGRLAFTTKMF